MIGPQIGTKEVGAMLSQQQCRLFGCWGLTFKTKKKMKQEIQPVVGTI